MSVVNCVVLDVSEFQNRLSEFGRRASARGKAVELGVWCNVVVMVASNIAVEMEDGPVAVETDQGVIAEIADDIAVEFGWPRTWLAEGIDRYLSGIAEETQGWTGLLSSCPGEREAGLKVFVPTSDRLLAMKAMGG